MLLDSPIAREVKNYTVQLGQTNITLPCNICAIPEPAFQWYFEETIIEGATQHMYMIYTVTSASFGVYTCHVNNSVGSNNITMHLLQSGEYAYASFDISVVLYYNWLNPRI